MKTEYTENGGFLQRDSVEHKEYAEVYSTNGREGGEKDGADLFEKVLSRDNLNKAYKRVKANKGASGIDGMTVDEAGSWLKEHKGELLEKIRNGKYKPSPVRRVEIPKDNGCQMSFAVVEESKLILTDIRYKEEIKVSASMFPKANVEKITDPVNFFDLTEDQLREIVEKISDSVIG